MTLKAEGLTATNQSSPGSCLGGWSYRRKMCVITCLTEFLKPFPQKLPTAVSVIIKMLMVITV